jgi:hypothetical protein
MSEQPTALRLADALKERKATHHTYSGTGKVTLVTGNSADPLCRDAAAELRRLHAVNAELLEALKQIAATKNLAKELEAEWCPAATSMVWVARAAIARAEGQS